MSHRILVVDDDASIRETFEIHLERRGYQVRSAETGENALNQLEAFGPSLVITDVRMPGMDGLELLRRVREGSDADVIVITAHESMESAVGAMKAGAYDYLVKPLDLKKIDHLVSQCFRDRDLRRKASTAPEKESTGPEPHRLVGRHPSMIEVYKLIGVLAENRATVLVTGETGTGKERIARAIHNSSNLASEPFIGVNCTAIPETLLESELFGHVRGAFTGAVGPRQGYFELAGEGTIFLDEIGDTAPEFQSKLLRVLEEGEFYPVGGERPRHTGARVIAATQTPLEERVREGRFRRDLFFRLQVVGVHVPPLRDRKEDIHILADHFLEKIGRELGKEVKKLSGSALNSLLAYDWPGNVRELEHALTRAAVLARGPYLDGGDFELGSSTLDRDPSEDTDQSLEAMEAVHVQKVLREVGGVKRQAAEVLKISRTRLDRIIEKHGLEVPE
ncbi:MAG: sigma-54-dependent Fis family transcriptional regulator [Gemmatimonadetes bacterium]|nr:sigma-54-dependent Fis family transcriptional regulator [Gemmatimonadota bacterium]